LYRQREQFADALPLSHYFSVLYRQRWRLLAFVSFCTTATFIFCLQTQPIYESTARMDVDRRAPTAIIGQQSLEAPPTNDSDQFLTTQIELIESDGVLRPVADKFQLLQREHQIPKDPKKAAQVSRAPINLKNLRVVRPVNSLFLRISYRSTDPQLASDVANEIARSYLERTYDIKVKSSVGLSAFMERQIEELRAKMVQSGEALALYEKELSVISPEENTNILSARLLALNTEYTSAQAERLRKQASYDSLSNTGSAAIENAPQASQLAALKEKLDTAKARFAEIKAIYGTNYIEYRRMANEMDELEKQYNEASAEVSRRVAADYQQSLHREELLKTTLALSKAEYDRLNLRSFQYQQLKREAEGDKSLYEELHRKIKEAGINAGFQGNSVRIADLARPAATPVFPRTTQMVVLSLLLSSLMGCIIAIAMDLLDTTLNDPDRARQLLQIEVVATLPEVGRSRLLLPSSQAHGLSSAKAGSLPWRQDDAAQAGLALVTYEESIRTLRNSITLSQSATAIRSILITSATPSEGKSTTAAHLAIAHAEQNKRTLLIDADLRKPSQHMRFDITNELGLSTALTNVLPWQKVLIKLPQWPNLDIIPAGPQSQRAADLIGPGMANLIWEASKAYDLVIVDAPMLTGLADPMQMAAATDGVIVVAHSGKTSKKAVATVLNCLDRVQANVIGLVLNRVTGKIPDPYYFQNVVIDDMIAGPSGAQSS
jgi:polysaccharide biosynthesis transport protein